MSELIIEIENRLENAMSLTEKLDILEIVEMVVDKLDVETNELAGFIEKKRIELHN